MGFNAVEGALTSERGRVLRVWLEKGRHRGRVLRLRSLARKQSVPVQEIAREILERMAGHRQRSAHQGVLASVAAVASPHPAEVLEACGERAVLLVADGVEDPRNLGALIRTAAGAGVAGVFIPRHRSAGLTSTVARVAAGAAEKVPVARVSGVPAFLKSLKRKGFWTVGLHAGAARSWDETSYPDKVALVVGSEGRGLRPLVRETCDELVSIPLAGGVESLNLSVAAGVCLYEVVRQRRERKFRGTPLLGRRADIT